jgi:hypothetical protein
MNASERDRGTGAGCLLVLGALFLLPSLMIGLWIAGESLRELQAIFSAFQWNSWSAFWANVLALFRPRGGPQLIPSLLFVMLLGYFVMMWQWMAHVCKWRLVLPPRRLWMMSSVYFITLALVLMHVTYPGFSSEWKQDGTKLLQGVISWVVISWLVPGTFLAITIPLWIFSLADSAKVGMGIDASSSGN